MSSFACALDCLLACRSVWITLCRLYKSIPGYHQLLNLIELLAVSVTSVVDYEEGTSTVAIIVKYKFRDSVVELSLRLFLDVQSHDCRLEVQFSAEHVIEFHNLGNSQPPLVVVSGDDILPARSRGLYPVLQPSE